MCKGFKIRKLNYHSASENCAGLARATNKRTGRAEILCSKLNYLMRNERIFNKVLFHDSVWFWTPWVKKHLYTMFSHFHCSQMFLWVLCHRHHSCVWKPSFPSHLHLHFPLPITQILTINRWLFWQVQMHNFQEEQSYGFLRFIIKHEL